MSVPTNADCVGSVSIAWFLIYEWSLIEVHVGLLIFECYGLVNPPILDIL